jgi:hypothetical protein
LFSTSLLLVGCSSCGPVTHLKKTLINIPKGVKTYQSAMPTANLIELENGIRVSFDWRSGMQYGSNNLYIVVWENPKKINPSFETDQIIELDANTLAQKNTFQIPKFVPMPAQPNDGYSTTVNTESYLEANPKIFKIPNLVINGHSYIIPELKIMKATEELCFRPSI